MKLEPIQRSLYCMGIAYYLVGSQKPETWLESGKLDLAFQLPWERLTMALNGVRQCRLITPELDRCLAILYDAINLDHVENTRYTVEQRGSWWQGYYKAMGAKRITPDTIEALIPDSANG